jgi:2-polyprenyl-3-methyl-5-hydroxy-6-metoxy-1,4-benzoquinol methylase
MLDKTIELLRLSKINKYIKPNLVILDLGCGYNGSLLNSISNKIKNGVGVDLSVSDKKINKNIKLIEGKADNRIELKSNSFDLVTALALIEHVENPGKMVKEAYRLLKKGGLFLITTPSVSSKPILEFLAFKLGVISYEEIKDHKRYYDIKSLKLLLIDSGFKANKININSFEFGMNILAIAKK